MYRIKHEGGKMTQRLPWKLFNESTELTIAVYKAYFYKKYLKV